MNFYLPLLILSIFSLSLQAKLVSSNLSATDREEVVQTLGHSSSLKLLNDPYSLGGYSGFEAGLTLESVSTKNLSELGDKTASGSMHYYPVITLGKGLYQDFDLFLHFSLYGVENRTGVYGGLMRWKFYESERIPLSISANVFSATNNFDNLITGDSSGLFFNVGLNFANSSCYLGVGKIRSKAIFSSELTSTPKAETARAEDIHLKIGGVMHFRPYFVAIELNRYAISHVSAKFGIRY